MQGITILLAALASFGLAAPHTGEISFGNMTLNKREDMAASCLEHLCCKNSKRNLEMATDHQADAEAQCLVCWKFGICGKRTDAVPEDNPGKVTDDDRNRGRRGELRRGGKGHVNRGLGGRWMYTFDD